MELPHGFTVTGHVCHSKNHYNIVFKELLNDPCIYTKTTAAELILIAIYVDGIFVVVKDKDAAIKKNGIEQDPNNNSILYTYQPTFNNYLKKSKITPMFRNLIPSISICR